MPTVCQILSKLEGHIRSIDQRLAAIGVGDSTGQGSFSGSLWEVSGDQIAVWSVDTVRPLSWSQGQWARLTAGRIEARGNAFEFMSSDTGARIVFDGSQLAGYSDATTKEFYLDAATGKAYFAGGNAVLSKDGIDLSAGLTISWLSPNQTENVYSIYSIIRPNPTENQAYGFRGVLGAAHNADTDYDINSLVGVLGWAWQGRDGTVESATGVYGYISTEENKGAVTNAAGVVSYIYNKAGTTISNAFLFWGQNVYNLGTIDTCYGLYLPTLSGTTRWGVYQAGSGDNNYFAGQVEVGGFKLSTGATNGYVLVSDADGVGTWQSTSGVGDMLKSVYDPNDDGVIADAQVASNITLTNLTQITNRAHGDLTGVSADQHHAQSHALTAHTGDAAWSQIDSLVAVGQLRDASRIMAKSIASPVTSKYLKYNGTSMVWDTPAGGNGVGEGDSPTWTGLHTFDNGATIIDAAAWGQTKAVRIARNINSAVNEFALCIQANVTGNTGADSNYEKCAILAIGRTADPSGATERDIVGIDARGYIGGSISIGRAWGVYGEARAESGADGMLAAAEFLVYNIGGSNQATPWTSTSKTGISIVAAGNNPCTAAIQLGRTGSCTWHYGMWCNPSDLNAATDRFIELLNVFSVKRDGTVIAGEVQFERDSNFKAYKIGSDPTYQFASGVYWRKRGDGIGLYQGGSILALFHTNGSLYITGTLNENWTP